MGFWSRLFKRSAPTNTIGTGGTAFAGGYVVSGENAGELSGRQRYISYASMVANTSIIAAGQRYDINLTQLPDWHALPPKRFLNDPEAKEIAEFVEECMGDMVTPWHQVVARAAMYKYVGFSWAEWTAKIRPDGRVGMADIEPRPQSTIEEWVRDNQGEVIACIQRDPSTGKEYTLPRWKAVYICDDTMSDSPEGLGLYRQLYPHAKQRQDYSRLEGIGYEIDLRGIPIGRAPLALLREQLDDGQLTQAQYSAAIAVIDNFVQHHIRSTKLGLVLDSQPFEATKDGGETPTNIRQWDVELMQGGPTSAAEVAAAITRCDHEMARVMQVEHLLLGENRGTQALAKDKSDNFRTLVESQLRQLARSFRQDFVLPLMQLNGFPLEKMPILETDPVAFSDVADLSGVLKDLSDAGIGVPPDYEGINVVLRQAGLPMIDLKELREIAQQRIDALASAFGTGNTDGGVNGNSPSDDEDDDGED